MRISGCRLKEKAHDRLAEFFVGGVTARSAADLARVNRKTAAYFFHRLRQIIARQLEDSLPVEGLVEVDESYFGGVRKGKRGRGAAGKIPVFGILKRGGKVHTVMIPDVRKDTLLPIIRQKVVPDSIVYTDSYPAALDRFVKMGFRLDRARQPACGGRACATLYLSVVPISLNTVLTLVPTAWTATMMNTAIRLAISAYSIAVTPDSSLRKFRTRSMGFS